MENQWESIFMYTSSIPDHPYLPNVEKSVYILGDLFDSIKDREAIANRLRSFFWATYRSGFPSIATRNGPTSDAGWGCMHRCSQMMLAEAITRVTLGCAWRWTQGCTDDAYCQLRRLFQDHKNSLYSIQNISMVGMAFDKPVGSWFGPNTAVQVIKKLCAYDPRTKWCVYIAVEDGIIMEEIKTRCRKQSTQTWNSNGEENTSGLPFATQLSEEGTEYDWELGAMKARFADDTEVIGDNPQISGPITRDLDEDFLEIVVPPTFEFNTPPEPASSSVAVSELEGQQNIGLSRSRTDASTGSVFISAKSSSLSSPTTTQTANFWRPLLLFIPLRLGLSQPNPCYFRAIKAVLHIKQCIGILGGRPSHAVWIVGVVEDGEDSLLCLDPHTTQPASIDQLTVADDLTHHCATPIRMPLQRLDPSLVLGFVCPTEADFDALYASLEQEVLSSSEPRYALFELHQTRPSNLPPIPLRPSGIGDDCIDPDASQVMLLTQGQRDTNNASGDAASEMTDPEHRHGGAINTMRDIWSKCNRAAEGAVRSFVNLTGQSGSGEGSKPV